VRLRPRDHFDPLPQPRDRQLRRRRDIEPADPHIERLPPQLAAPALRTGLRALVLPQIDANILLVTLRLPRTQEGDRAPETTRPVDDVVAELLRQLPPRRVDRDPAPPGEGQQLRPLATVTRLLPEVDRALRQRTRRVGHDQRRGRSEEHTSE